MRVIRSIPEHVFAAWWMCAAVSGVRSLPAADAPPTSHPTAISAILENWNSIRCWSGTAVVEDRGAIAGGESEVVRSRATFVLDRQLRRFKWQWNPESAADTPAASSRTVRTAGMVKHHAIYRFADDAAATTTAGFSRRTVAITDLTSTQEPFATGEFDLPYFLTAGFNDLDTVLKRREGSFSVPLTWHSVRTTPDGMDEYLSQDGDTSIRVTVAPALSNVVANVRRETPDGHEQWSFQYEEHGNVRLPRDINVEVHSSDGTSVQRRIRLEGSQLNQKSAPDEWSLAQIGVRAGDVVRDGRAGVQYVYGGPASSRPAPFAPAAGSAVLPWHYVALNVVAWMAVIAGAAFISRWKKSGASRSDHGVTL